MIDNKRDYNTQFPICSILLLKDDGLCLSFQCEKLDPADVEAVARTVKRVLTAYGTPALKEMIKNCMTKDLSWKVSMLLS